MAFEIYDDMAFFWFALTWLFVALVPFKWYMIALLRTGDVAEADTKTEFGRDLTLSPVFPILHAKSKSRYRSDCHAHEVSTRKACSKG